MPRIVRGALLQASWTGDKESMIQKHEQPAHEAAKQGAQFMLFQELFYGPYFCQVQDAQYYSYTELIPDGPTTKRMQDLAKQTGMVLVVPMYEEDAQASGIYYNTAAVIDADGTYLGKYRKTHIPHVKGFWEKFYFRPGNTGYPVFETAVGKVGVYICYDRHFPEGARALGLNGAEIVFIPSATSRGLSEYLWRIEQPSHAVANGYFVGTINRVGIEADIGDDDFYGQSYFVDPRGPVRRRRRRRPRRGADRPRPGPRQDHGSPQHVAVLPRPPARRVRDLTRRRRYHPRGSAVWRRTAEPPRSREGRAMQFGFTLKPDHTIERTLALTRQAEAAGFDYGWLFDSHVLWRDPYPLLTLMAGATERLRLGTCVTNPGTREPSVTASALATLDEISEGRMDLGIGRGDSARRVLGKPPITLAHTEEAIRVIRALVAGGTIDYEGTELHVPVDARLDAAGVGRRLRPDGPRDDRPGRRRDHPPAGRPGPHPLVRRPGPRGGDAPPAGPAARSRSRRPRRPTSARATLGRERTRWFPALVSNHVVDLVNKYPREELPEALTGYITDRTGYDYHHHAEVGSSNAAFVGDEVTDRFCVLGERGRARRQAARAGRGRRRPVQPLPHERRRGGPARGLRPGRHPGAGARLRYWPARSGWSAVPDVARPCASSPDPHGGHHDRPTSAAGDPFWDDGSGARRRNSASARKAGWRCRLAIGACGLTAAMWLRQLLPVVGIQV